MINKYKKEIVELNELINKNSENIRNHPYKLFVWLNSNCDPTIEILLDIEILSNVKKWLRQRDLSEKALPFWQYGVRIVRDDLDLCNLTIEIVNKQVIEGQKWLKIGPDMIFYEWHEPKTDQELVVAERLKLILEKVLVNYSTLIDPKHHQLGILYWSALGAGTIEEKYMAELYKIIHNDPDFASMWWYAEHAESARPMLISMLQSNNPGISRLAAISLLAISGGRYPRHERKRIEEAWAGDKYWEFAQDKEEVWRPRYIEGMSQCRLKWAEKGPEWLEAIKEANTEKLQNAWCRVIEEADYDDVKDHDALFNLLLHILESGDTFAKDIRFAALRRLNEIVSEAEPIGFNEEPLNLPLSRRARSFFS